LSLPVRIIHEDESLIVVDKPAGWPSQRTPDPRRANIEDWVRAHASGSKIHLVHRLDRDTSGLLVFCKSGAWGAHLTAQFQRREVKKIYGAWVAQAGVPKPAWAVRNHLAESSGKPRRMRSVRAGGQVAETFFSVLESRGGVSWLQCEPRTGRTHQIRVHLAESGCAILRDELYTSTPLASTRFVPAFRCPRLALHAHRISFVHPQELRPVEFVADWPADLLEFWKTLPD
jgi:RluA family pseudouridine synthase